MNLAGNSTKMNVFDDMEGDNSSFILTVSPQANRSRNLMVEDAAATDLDLNTDLDLIVILLTSFILGILILTTVVGNVFVIAAILLDRHLQSVANYLILSLAVADLLVAVLVMPLGAVYEITQKWSLGPTLCDMWTCSDVLCCTASILHLLAIAVDRFWAVTQAHYIHSRNTRNISLMICLVWIMSVVVSLAPLLGWKDSNWSERVDAGVCIVSQDISYQIFATSATFFVPLVLILILYWRIFVTARTRLRNRMAQKAKIPLSSSNGQPRLGQVIQSARIANSIRIDGETKPQDAAGDSDSRTKTTSFSSIRTSVLQANNASVNNGEANANHLHNGVANCNNNHNGAMAAAVSATPERSEEPSPSCSQNNTLTPRPRPPVKGCARHQSGTALQRCTTASQTEDMSPILASGRSGGSGAAAASATAEKPPKRKKEKKHVSLEAKREKKAAKTLAIVTGAFILCWLPFFVTALVMPLCEDCIDGRIFSFFLWLGYFNSTLNPIIYTVFSPEFRQAFKKLLCGRSNPENYRPRHLQ